MYLLEKNEKKGTNLFFLIFQFFVFYKKQLEGSHIFE